jgi:hypothetical protein
MMQSGVFCQRICANLKFFSLQLLYLQVPWANILPQQCNLLHLFPYGSRQVPERNFYDLQVCLTRKNTFIRAVIFHLHSKHHRAYGATFASTIRDMLSTGAFYISDEFVTTRNEGMDERRAESLWKLHTCPRGTSPHYQDIKRCPLLCQAREPEPVLDGRPGFPWLQYGGA